MLNAHRKGLIALYAPEKRTNAEDAEQERAAQLKEIFGAALYLETYRFPASGQDESARGGAAGTRAGCAARGSKPAHFLRPAEYLHHRVLNAIRTGSLVTRMAPPEIADAEAYFKTADEMQRAFADHPEAMRATLEIAEKAQLELELGRTIFPEFPCPPAKLLFHGCASSAFVARSSITSRCVRRCWRG